MNTTNQTALEHIADKLHTDIVTLKVFIIANEIRLYPEESQEEILSFVDEFLQLADKVFSSAYNLVIYHWNNKEK